MECERGIVTQLTAEGEVRVGVLHEYDKQGAA